MVMAERDKTDETLIERAREWVRNAGIESKYGVSWLTVQEAAAFAQSIQADAHAHCTHCICECPECKKP